MGKKILLADDSITIQKVIELTFSDEDFEVVTVGNGRLALEKLEEVRPDVVLCDIIMPEKDGYEVCDHIKKHASLSHVPVLLLTGAFEPFDQERAARVGCDGYLAKPFEPQTLIAKVKDLLNQTAARPRAATAPPAPERPAPPAPPAAPPAFVPPAEPLFEPITEPEPVYDTAEPSPIDEPPAPAGTYSEPLDLTPEPGTPPPPYAQPGEAAAPGAVEDLLSEEEPLEASPEEFMPLMAEEEESLARPLSEAEPTPSAPGGFEGARTMIFQADETPPWSSPTMEVPLEARAQASAAAASEVERTATAPKPAPAPAQAPPGPVDEPVFEPDFGEPVEAPAPGVEAAAPAAAEAPPPAEPTPPIAVPPPPPAPAPGEPTPEPAYASFADLRTEEPAAPAAAPSQAAEVSVPVDQVAQIAQRVVAQISERVVREVAWEVVPDLAEALIKKEIERLRAELEKV
jgi:CheY-like chemotaxis protein